MNFRTADRIGRKRETIPLNHVDYLWLVLEDLMPSMGQLITLRFKTRHGVEDMASALRHMMRIYPRLRHLVCPALCTYRLEILPDTEIDDYFQDIFTVETGNPYESDSFMHRRRNFLNRGFDLERELPLRAVFFPDHESPTLLLSLHHITCDGMGWRHLVDTLMAFLNGKTVMPLPVEDNRIYSSFLEKPISRVPRQLFRSWKNNRENVSRNRQGKPFIYPLKNWCPVFGPTDMHEQDLSLGLDVLKGASRRYDCTITVLLMAALALTMEELDSSDRGGDTAHIHFLIDLRPFMKQPAPVFGNYIISGLVRAHNAIFSDYRALVNTVKEQLRYNLAQAEKKNIIMPILINALIKVVGRRLSVRIAHIIEKKGLLSFTYVFSNMGNLGALNRHGSGAVLLGANATVSQQGIFFVTSCIGNTMNMVFSYPEREVSRKEIQYLINVFEKHLKTIVGG